MNINNSISTTVNFIIFFLLSLLILCSCRSKTNKNEINNALIVNQNEFLEKNENFRSKFEDKISEIYKKNNLVGDFLLAVVNEKGLVYSFAINNEIVNNNPTSLDNNSPIYIASHTKAFTGTLLKIMAEKDIIDLDKSVYEYLPELTLHDSIDTRKIKVRQLLNHTHGMYSTMFTWRTAFLGYEGGDIELINDFNKNYKFDPSHKFRYSNTGPILAAMIVEKLTGNSWKDELSKYIFKPLEMFNSSANVSDFDPKKIRPITTVAKDGNIFRSGFYKENITMHASGGIISTINDLSKWLKTNINQENKIFQKEGSWEELHSVTADQNRTFFTYKRHGYSLGWDIATYQNDTIITRFGGYAGSVFHTSFIPSKKIGIIAFSTDNRATSLTHLAANYVYNTLSNLSNAEEIFDSEKKLFDKRFDRNSKQLIDYNDLLEPNDKNNFIIGTFTNDFGWPNIEISRTKNSYEMKWGILNGTIYNFTDPESPFIASLGALNRRFNVSNDSLFTGSLIYIKK